MIIRKIATFVISAGLVCAHALFAKPANAQNLLQVPGKTLSALSDLQTAVDSLNKAKAAADELLAGKKPTTIDSEKWADLARRYKESALELRSAPLVTDFDRAQYTVSFDQVNNPATHDVAIAKLQGYLRALQQALALGRKEQEQIGLQITAVNRVDDVLGALIKASARLSTLPDIGSTFAWNWADLELVVQPAVRDLRSALQGQQRKLQQETDKVAMYESNLRGNLPAWEALFPKSPWMGNWRSGVSSSSVSFGGPPYYNYRTTLQSVVVAIDISREGKVTGASADMKAIEEVLNGRIGTIPINSHSYHAAGGTITGNHIQITFNRVVGEPQCTAAFNGNMVGNRIVGSLTVHRIVNAAQLAWTITVSATLTR